MVNALPHSWHLKGLSPVCVRMCRSRLELHEGTYEQPGHVHSSCLHNHNSESVGTRPHAKRTYQRARPSLPFASASTLHSRLPSLPIPTSWPYAASWGLPLPTTPLTQPRARCRHALEDAWTHASRLTRVLPDPPSRPEKTTIERLCVRPHPWQKVAARP